MSDFEYIRSTYDVPAEIGRKVVVAGRPGVIAKSRNQYIGVNFDDSKPGVISICHPTWKVEYQGMGEIRKMTRSQARYRRYLDLGSELGFDNFLNFCYWDAEQK